jgi:ADP-heptose:LPS heptosyltransferase
MKIAAHVTEKVMFSWPVEYWVEFFRKVTRDGHEVYIVGEDDYVEIRDKNPLLFDRLRMGDEVSRQVISKCDVFVGPPLKYYEMAKDAKVRTVAMLGATFKADGVKSSTQCAGCLDHLENVNDCLWEDSLCMWEIPPNDILKEVLCCV